MKLGCFHSPWKRPKQTTMTLPAMPAMPHFPSLLEPGQFVRHPGCPDWGLGQVQSVVGARVTVNFEHAGKVLINAALVGLEPVHP
jgi:hypothetical protein